MSELEDRIKRIQNILVGEFVARKQGNDSYGRYSKYEKMDCES